MNTPSEKLKEIHERTFGEQFSYKKKRLEPEFSSRREYILFEKHKEELRQIREKKKTSIPIEETQSHQNTNITPPSEEGIDKPTHFSFGLYSPRLEKVLNYSIGHTRIREILFVDSYSDMFAFFNNRYGYRYQLEQAGVSESVNAKFFSLLTDYEHQVQKKDYLQNRDRYYAIRKALDPFFSHFLPQFREKYHNSPSHIQNEIHTILDSIGPEIPQIFLSSDLQKTFIPILPLVKNTEKLQAVAMKLLEPLGYSHTHAQEFFTPLTRVRRLFRVFSYRDFIEDSMNNAGIEGEVSTEIRNIFIQLSKRVTGKRLRVRFAVELPSLSLSREKQKKLIEGLEVFGNLQPFDEIDDLSTVETCEYHFSTQLQNFMKTHPDISHLVEYDSSKDLAMFVARRDGITSLLREISPALERFSEKFIAFIECLLYDKQTTYINIAQCKKK